MNTRFIIVAIGLIVIITAMAQCEQQCVIKAHFDPLNNRRTDEVR